MRECADTSDESSTELETYECSLSESSQNIQTETLTTIYDGTRPTYGNMFDLFSEKDIIIVSVDLHISSIDVMVNVELYVTCCTLETYNNVMRHPTAWTLFSSTSVVAKGSGVSTSLPTTTIITKGQSRGFYFTSVNGMFLLQTKLDNLSEGDVYISNFALSMFVGIGKNRFHCNVLKILKNNFLPRPNIICCFVM